MIYFNLPDFYHNFKLINFLYHIMQAQNKSDFFKTDVQFAAATGSFPYAIWNGQWNCVDGATFDGRLFPLANDYSCHKDLSLMTRLNCSNVFIEDEMFEDEYMNILLEKNQGLNNCIEVSNLNLLDYIHERFPKYRFVFSENSELIKEPTAEMLNTLTDFDILYKVKISYKTAQDFELLKQLKNRNKIEITVNSLCPINCPSYHDCRICSDQAQVNYSNQNPFLSCQKNANFMWDFRQAITLEQIEETYLPLGYKYYNFAPMPMISLYNKLLYYFSYFFKPEKVTEMLKLFNDQEHIFQ